MLIDYVAVSAVVYWNLISVERTSALWASRLGIFLTLLRVSIRLCSLIVINCRSSSNTNNNNYYYYYCYCHHDYYNYYYY